MTDLEKLVGLLNSFGVEYTVVPFPKRIVVECAQGQVKVGGETGTYVNFEFDTETEKFEEMGAWDG